jgi:hypothetical protein
LPKSVGTVLLEHRQRGSQGFDVLDMEHCASLPETGHKAYTPLANEADGHQRRVPPQRRANSAPNGFGILL